MAKDGTNRGGRRVRAGAKPEPLNERLAQGKSGRVLAGANLPKDPALFGTDLGDGVVLSGEAMPKPSAYLKTEQRDGKPLGADVLFTETWEWLSARGCAALISPRLIESYAMAFARYIQCEEAVSTFGLLGKHPTTGAAIQSPFVAMSQAFQKQANVLWYEIFDVVKANCATDYSGPTPAEDVMELLLRARTK